MKKVITFCKDFFERIEKTKFYNKRIAFLFFLLVIFSLAGWFLFANYESNKVLKIGVVTDIHAANDKVRMADGRPMGYPRKYSDYFPLALDEMKKEKVDFVLALGDNTNIGKPKYAESLMKIVREKKMDVIWVKGNHDRKKTEVMKYFDVNDTDYYRDMKDWRVVVLDTTKKDNSGYAGSFTDEQLNWLQEALKTDKKVVIAMHHTIWKLNDFDNIYPVYENFEKIISQSKNVKYVFSGHYHEFDIVKTHNGVEYHIVPSLVQDQNKANFKILELK